MSLPNTWPTEAQNAKSMTEDGTGRCGWYNHYTNPNQPLTVYTRASLRATIRTQTAQNVQDADRRIERFMGGF